MDWAESLEAALLLEVWAMCVVSYMLHSYRPLEAACAPEDTQTKPGSFLLLNQEQLSVEMEND